MDTLPVWVKVAAAFIPLAAATVTGILYFLDRPGKRIDRIKQLNEIRKDTTNFLNPDRVIERVMLYEIQKLERTYTPWYRWFRRALVGGWVVYLALFIVSIFRDQLGMSDSTYWIVSSVGALGLLVAVASLQLSKKNQVDLNSKYRAKHEALKIVVDKENAALRESSSADEELESSAPRA